VLRSTAAFLVGGGFLVVRLSLGVQGDGAAACGLGLVVWAAGRAMMRWKAFRSI
jgi:type IV secretory pathway TrbD component